MIVQTLESGLALLTFIAFLGVVISFLSSPIIVLWWVVDTLRSKHNTMLADKSAHLVRVFHVVTTALVLFFLILWARA